MRHIANFSLTTAQLTYPSWGGGYLCCVGYSSCAVWPWDGSVAPPFFAAGSTMLTCLQVHQKLWINSQHAKKTSARWWRWWGVLAAYAGVELKRGRRWVECAMVVVQSCIQQQHSLVDSMSESCGACMQFIGAASYQADWSTRALLPGKPSSSLEATANHGDLS